MPNDSTLRMAPSPDDDEEEWLDEGETLNSVILQVFLAGIAIGVVMGALIVGLVVWLV